MFVGPEVLAAQWRRPSDLGPQTPEQRPPTSPKRPQRSSRKLVTSDGILADFVRVLPSALHGLGVFAHVPLARGALVGRYRAPTKAATLGVAATTKAARPGAMLVPGTTKAATPGATPVSTTSTQKKSKILAA